MNLFKKSSKEVPEVTLPEDVDGLTAEATQSPYQDEQGSKIPPSIALKEQIRDMERSEEAGNLYSTYKASRLTRKERD
eukprot:CAMPEP_0185585116 /NCGR_PEP_ID=MMETSP0434-20130131/36596_1 /TAXON_ID=626734 ORGANISM="Favella taraikaensis, Strain Fe Narragansett Bay" /NCGR_SAMPLE_ID=MMETSP0434 /ASSEMBLY_ACC=CAM_ASM_000379 /LENGTH=77 /DNA_ID=CAMNT_0028205253 /DNA_START=62 /DNA_END=295 /DNA_ORIENTATION=-